MFSALVATLPLVILLMKPAVKVAPVAWAGTMLLAPRLVP